MLNAFDTDVVLRCIKGGDFEWFELYCEQALSFDVSLRNRIVRAAPSQTAGISLRVVKNGVTHKYFRNDLELGEMIEGIGLTSEVRLPRLAGLPPTPWPHQEALIRLGRVAGSRVVDYHDTRRIFFVAQSVGPSGSGREESARLEWDGEKKLVSASIDRLWQKAFQVMNQWSLPASPKTRWPLPGGTIGILWRPEALSQLLLPFVRHFESDRMLGSESLLTQLSFPQPLFFSLFDGGSEQSDHEGVPSRPLPLFVDGRPRSLACNSATAREMGVPPTGNSRRTSYLLPPTIGFWRVKMAGHEKFTEPLKALGNGLLVHDASYNFAETAIRIAHAQLVHDGELGEDLEPTTLPLPLTEFLKSLGSFSEVADTIGISIQKAGHTLITDCDVPWGLSPAIASPGNPCLTYW
ncbi:MAG: hypothetical protein HYR96_00660 [Deltaproteobacteria bacterium]|nr:hypothetical protein [Deltaproteobacteria bacterium]MBI3294622.1 hypothetical protein [Deltaproteobacteria bacterium]